MEDDTAPNAEGEATPAGADASAEKARSATAPFLFLFGSLGLVGSVVAFVVDLVTGYDILRSLAVNAGSAAVLIFWAARDTLTDPDSSVDSTGGAAGTGLLLLGLYLALGAAVVGATSPVHDRFGVVPRAAGLGIALVVAGFLVLPRERILGDDAGDDSETGGESDG